MFYRPNIRTGLQATALACLFTFSSIAQEKKTTPSVTSIAELQAAIQKVLDSTKTPAAGVALVNSKGPVWIAGLGTAHVEKSIKADSTTMFRIGSTSKMFVSLSILKLQEEGRVKLDDKVRDLVPDLVFENQWEATDPVRVAHLLEHTTGWDDIHLIEYAHNEDVPVSLKDGLAYHPHSRISRWVPGTRMSYCNSGPPVAAYIVERITGMPFEDYVQENFFRPMGMTTMTYLRTDTYKEKGAELYEDGKPQPYWNVIMRPSGSINASPIDMAKMVRFFVNGAKVDSISLVSPSSLQRMETPSTTSGARAGMRAGYGLNNYTSFHKGFVYQSHNGGVNGGLTDLSYLPGYGVGYVVMINAGNGDALKQIVDLIRDYQTRDFTSPAVANDIKINEQHHALAGYYVPINPRNQKFYFLDRMLGVQKIWADEESLHQGAVLGGDVAHFLPVTDVLLKSKETGMTNLVKTTDPLDGEVIHSDTDVFRPASFLSALSPLVMGILWLVFAFSTLLFAPIWGVRYWMGKISVEEKLGIRLWPLLASIFFIVIFVLITIGGGDPFNYLGKPGPVSIGIMVFTNAFALMSFWSLYIAFKERRATSNKYAYWHSSITSLLHVAMTLYLMSYGVIGMRIWN